MVLITEGVGGGGGGPSGSVQTYAQTTGNNGSNAEFVLQADVIGDPGSTITLVANGTDNIGTIVAAWNAANPGNTVQLIDGLGTTVPTAGNLQFVGGGTTGFESGTVDMGLMFLQGSLMYLKDTVNNLQAINFAGNVTPLFGIPSVGVLNGGIDLNTGQLGIMAASTESINFFITDQSTYNASLRGNSSDISLNFGNLIFFLTSSGNIGWGEDNGGQPTYLLPIGSTPSLGQVLGVVGIVGNTYSLDFITGTGGGGNTVQVTLLQDLTAYAGNIVGMYADASGGADFLFKQYTQSPNTANPGNTLQVKNLKQDQRINLYVTLDDADNINIAAQMYDVERGQFSGNWSSVQISGLMIDTTKQISVAWIDNTHFAVSGIGDVSSPGVAYIVTCRLNGVNIEVTEVHPVENGATSYNSFQLATTVSSNTESYENLSFVGWRDDNSTFVIGKISHNAIWKIRATTSNAITGFTTEADTVDFVAKGHGYDISDTVMLVLHVSGDVLYVKNDGTIIAAGTLPAPTDIFDMSYIGQYPSAWNFVYQSQRTTGDCYVGVVSFDGIGITFSSETQIFGVAVYNTNFYSQSISTFRDNIGMTTQPQYSIHMRMLGPSDFQIAVVELSYVMPYPLIAGVVTVDIISGLNPDWTKGVAMINNRRYEPQTERQFWMFTLDYIDSNIAGNSNRLVRAFLPDGGGSGAIIDYTWAKAIFSNCNCLVIPDGSSTQFSTATAYLPGAELPYTSGITTQYLGSDGLSVTGMLTDIVALEHVDNVSIVRLTPIQLKSIDCYSGGGYPTEGYNLYKFFSGANAMTPNITVPGYLTNEVLFVNEINNSTMNIYLNNVNNTGTQVLINQYDGFKMKYDSLRIKPTVDIVNPGWDILECNTDMCRQSIAVDNPVYYDSGTKSLYVPIPVLYQNYADVQIANTGAGVDIQYMYIDASIDKDVRLKLQPADGSIDIIQQPIASAQTNALFGLNTTVTLSAHSALYYGDWIEFDRLNNAWFKYNIEIYL